MARQLGQRTGGSCSASSKRRHHSSGFAHKVCDADAKQQDHEKEEYPKKVREECSERTTNGAFVRTRRIFRKLPSDVPARRHQVDQGQETSRRPCYPPS